MEARDVGPVHLLDRLGGPMSGLDCTIHVFSEPILHSRHRFDGELFALAPECRTPLTLRLR